MAKTVIRTLPENQWPLHHPDGLSGQLISPVLPTTSTVVLDRVSNANSKYQFSCCILVDSLCNMVPVLSLTDQLAFKR